MPNPQSSQQSRPNSTDALQQTQRFLAWSAYQEALKEIDQKASQQFQTTVSSLRTALWIRLGTHILQVVVVSIALFVGLFQVESSTSVNYVGIGTMVASFLLLTLLLFRNPIPSINRILVDLTRVQIILQGYVRQMHQIDAVFKQAFLEKEVDIGNVSRSLAHVQKVVDGNLESLLQFLEEMSF